MSEPLDDETFGSTVFNNLLNMYIVPEIERRRQVGQETPPIRAAQVVFFTDDRPTVVRLDAEVKAIATPNYKVGVTKQPGEPVFEHEVESLGTITLTDDDDPDCGHITFLSLAGTWSVSFDFRRYKGTAKRHIEAAREFRAAATFSMSCRHWRAYIDNLYSAAELAVQALLLVLFIAPTKADPPGRRHHIRKDNFDRFAELGNAAPTHRAAFNLLADLRTKVRYLEVEVSLAEDDARDLLDTVSEMINDIERRATI
jgi:HEPN domain-containing protein